MRWWKLSVVIAVMATGILWWWMASRPPVVITQIDTVTKVVEVPVDRLTTETVIKYIHHPEDGRIIEQLMAENKRLKVEVQQLSVSLAESTSTTTGPVTIEPPSTPESNCALPATLPAFSYNDWRMRFFVEAGWKSATYTLSQKFSIVNTVGVRETDGTPVQTIRLFEIGANGERTPIPTTETTTIVATPNQVRWRRTFAVQAGIGVFPTTEKATPSGVIATPWLRRGMANSAEQSSWAALTPIVAVTNTDVVVGLAPISMNLRTVVKTPLRDVWVSPIVGLSLKTSVKKYGVSFTATF